MTVEHLLLGLLEEDSVTDVLVACGADVDTLRQELDVIIEESVPVLPSHDERDTQPTPAFQRVLQRAVYHVQSAGGKEVSGANVLVSLFGEKDSHAIYYLEKQEITRLDVVNYVNHHIAKSSDPVNRPGFASHPSRPHPISAMEARLAELEARLSRIEKKLGD